MRTEKKGGENGSEAQTQAEKVGRSRHGETQRWLINKKKRIRREGREYYEKIEVKQKTCKGRLCRTRYPIEGGFPNKLNESGKGRASLVRRIVRPTRRGNGSSGFRSKRKDLKQEKKQKQKRLNGHSSPRLVGKKEVIQS